MPIDDTWDECMRGAVALKPQCFADCAHSCCCWCCCSTTHASAPPLMLVLHYAGEPLFYEGEAGGPHAEHVITEDDDEVRTNSHAVQALNNNCTPCPGAFCGPESSAVVACIEQRRLLSVAPAAGGGHHAAAAGHAAGGVATWPHCSAFRLMMCALLLISAARWWP